MVALDPSCPIAVAIELELQMQARRGTQHDKRMHGTLTASVTLQSPCKQPVRMYTAPHMSPSHQVQLLTLPAGSTTCQLLTGGWWLICSQYTSTPLGYRDWYVSPRMGLKGLWKFVCIESDHN
jgi:hypothetical protein